MAVDDPEEEDRDAGEEAVEGEIGEHGVGDRAHPVGGVFFGLRRSGLCYLMERWFGGLDEGIVERGLALTRGYFGDVVTQAVGR